MKIISNDINDVIVIMIVIIININDNKILMMY